MRGSPRIRVADASASEPDDFLERPAFQVSATPPLRPRFEDGEVLARRFRIERLLGRGGMGEVYEAYDSELSTSVALKTIRPDLASDERLLGRLRAEVLRARTVSHPNVCRVHDLFADDTTDGGVRFLTMELIRGETLAARLERGPLSTRLTALVAIQIADAVDEAHRHGVVHRDLKPGNVMLAGDEREPRAVVMDFGLAHLQSQPTASAGSSEPRGGTLAYVAPEVLEGGPLGTAVDIYSFGILLQEMLDARGVGGPGEVSRMPRRWRRLIEACAEADARRRPRSAGDAVRRAIGATRPGRLQVPAALVLSGLLGVALWPPLSRYLHWQPVLAGTALVMGEIANATAEPELDAVTDLMARQLSHSRHLTLLGPERVNQVLRTMAKPSTARLAPEVAREVVWRSGADGFVTGRVWRAGSAYALTIRLEARSERPDDAGRNWSRSYEGRDRNELREHLRSAASWVRANLGETRGEIPRTNPPVADVTTSSWQALHLYSRAEELLAQGRQEDALALLAQAVRIDSDFALAWMRMGDVLMSRRQLDEGYERWSRALSVLERRRLGSREEYRIRGMFASDTHDFAEAERYYRLYLVTYPNDFAPHFYIARPLLMLGRVDDAIRMLQVARQKDPSSYAALAQLAMLNLRAGRLEAAAHAIAELRALDQPGWASCIEGQLLFLRGAYDAALDRFKALSASPDAVLRSRAPGLQAAVLADTGRTAEAADLLREAVVADTASGDVAGRVDKLLALASLQLRLGRTAECRTLCVLAEHADRSPVRLAQLAAMLARTGDVVNAERLLGRLPEKSPSRRTQSDRRRVAGEILLARRRVQEAWTAFTQAAALEAPGVYCEYLARAAEAKREPGIARELYARMAREPGYYWRYPDNDYPGTWFEALTHAVRLGAGGDLAERRERIASYHLATSTRRRHGESNGDASEAAGQPVSTAGGRRHGGQGR
jgi:tetratricopeptide (TPR) repeat protein